MTDARVPRKAQVVLLNERKLEFLVQVRLRLMLYFFRTKQNCWTNSIFSLCQKARTSDKRSLGHGRIAF